VTAFACSTPGQFGAPLIAAEPPTMRLGFINLVLRRKSKYFVIELDLGTRGTLEVDRKLDNDIRCHRQDSHRPWPWKKQKSRLPDLTRLTMMEPRRSNSTRTITRTATKMTRLKTASLAWSLLRIHPLLPPTSK
jgi:hypothetical protein